MGICYSPLSILIFYIPWEQQLIPKKRHFSKNKFSCPSFPLIFAGVINQTKKIMEKVLIILALAVSNLMLGQEDFNPQMDRALELWEKGRHEEASALFEEIASVEKENWLPNYYVALVNTTSAFQIKDFKKVDELLGKAQSSLDQEFNKQPENAELLVLQAMIHTARIVLDPMYYGPQLSGTIGQLYSRAEAIAPNNPRVVLSKAQFELGAAHFFGTDTKSVCAQFEKAIKLFDNFKPEAAYYPNWGKTEANAEFNKCK